MSKVLFEGTRNKLFYASQKVINYCYEELRKDWLNEKEAEEIERLEELAFSAERISQTGVADSSEDWIVIKKFTAMADGFRAMKSIASLLK